MDSKEDDDITIDFSKVKTFFRRKKQDKAESSPKSEHQDNSQEPHKEHHEHKEEHRHGEHKEAKHEAKEDDEITIDFGRIKNIFKSDEKESKKEEKQETAESDDEISIDFGKIKNFFKGKEEHKEHHEHKEKGPKHQEHHEKTKEDDELNIDFGKIKNVFKFSSEEKQESEDDMSVNWDSLRNFFRNYGVVLLALLPIILSIYIRMQAGYLPITDDWAANSVINGISNQIRAQVNQQFPNLPDINREALVEKQLNDFISKNKAQVDNQVMGTSQYFKSFFQDDQGNVYMPDIDPYYWVRYAKNIVENGHPGDILKDGVPYDTFQLAPIGRVVFGDTFHSYSIAYLYKIFRIFSPDITIMRASFYLPLLVSSLSILLVFLIARKIAGNLGGFFAALMMAVNTSFLARTLFGHVDNDMWVIFFPLLITWLFIVTIETKTTLRAIIISALAGFSTGLYTFAWNGWWYIFDFLIGTMVALLVYLFIINFEHIRRRPHFVLQEPAIKNLIIVLIIYFITTAIFTVVFTGWAYFWNSFTGPLKFTTIKDPVTKSLWPNVLTTVAELNEGSVNAIINSVGGQFFFFISLIGLILAMSREGEEIKRSDFIYILGTILFYGLYFLVRRVYDISVNGLIIWIMLPIALRILIAMRKKDVSHDFRLSLLLSLWVASTIFASIKGIRFTILLSPAFSVAFGVALGKIYNYFSGWSSRELKIPKMLTGTIIILLFMLLYANPIRGAYNAAGSDLPIINDAWYNSLKAIKDRSNPNGIITSWWDFGHHFKWLAERRVTFDGTTQTSAAAHWVGKLFLTDNEKEAAGILRMLDCGQNTANNILTKNHTSAGMDLHKSLRIINQIIVLDKEEAVRKLLEEGLAKEQADEIVAYTHCDSPPEGYVIASEDMIGKSGVWSHFGSWNFEKADIWYSTRKLSKDEAVNYMKTKFNYTVERAENLYFEMQAITSDGEANAWISPWPGYPQNGNEREISCSKSEEGLFVCRNGLQVNLTSYDVYGQGQQGIIRPRIVVFTTKDGTIKKKFEGNTIDFGMTLIPVSENELQAIMSSKELTGSIFTRLFFMNGHGLKYFKPFEHQTGLTGTDIFVYKMDWEGKNTTIVESYANNLDAIANQSIKKAAENIEDKATDIRDTQIQNDTIDDLKVNVSDNATTNNLKTNSSNSS